MRLVLVLVSLLIAKARAPVTDQPTTIPFYGPCSFPSPNSPADSEVREYMRVCHVRQRLEFLCDLHLQFTQQSLHMIGKMFEKHKRVLTERGQFNIGILLVRQLTQPVSTEFVTDTNPEFSCLFRTPCQTMTPELVQKFVHNIKTFTRLYTASLFTRWFPSETCRRPKVLVVVVIDGILGDTRKLTSVNVHADDHLASYVANIQMETANTILQGVPIADALADLVDQLGYAFRDFYATNGEPRRHVIPMWAWELATVSVVLVVLALAIEWYIVRRKIASKRSISGVQLDSVRSKTHLIF